MERLNITKGEVSVSENKSTVVSNENCLVGRFFYGKGVALLEHKQQSDNIVFSNAKLYVDAHNTYNNCGILPSELLKQKQELVECLFNSTSIIKWYMQNTTPDNQDYQTFHDLGMNHLSELEEILTKNK